MAIFGGSGGDDGRQLLSDVALLDVAAMTWAVTNNFMNNYTNGMRIGSVMKSMVIPGA